MQPEASVFNITVPLNNFPRLSSHFRLATTKPMSFVYSTHVLLSGSGSFLQLIYLQMRKSRSLTFLQPRTGESLQVLHRLGEPFPAAPGHCPHITCDSRGDPRERGHSLREMAIGLGSAEKQSWAVSRPSPAGGKGTMGVVKKFLNVSKTLTLSEVLLGGQKYQGQCKL